MKIVVLHSPKGGSGKSTLARELATAAATAGKRVALADLDPQGTTGGWYDRREAKAPSLVALDPQRPNLAQLADAFDLLFVDTPPGTHKWFSALLGIADAVLVPVRPSPDDLMAAAPIAAALGAKPWAFVLTQVPARSRLADQAVRVLAALGKVAPATIGFRQDYPASAVAGGAAVELADTKAAGEMTSLLQYVMKALLRG